ncbi:C39 family peptidase [Bacteroides sp. GM023]|uniref:C39 family peptidase n=1 Tax=Bacteroides sp. GM023 TaxID=2723058 RepID=UPI00168AAB6A|nr:C39 family peptidase [Bacteroides sp. GM023]MBD3587851.1 hypothetical protein [Bacteroides sp. GM023]
MKTSDWNVIICIIILLTSCATEDSLTKYDLTSIKTVNNRVAIQLIEQMQNQEGSYQQLKQLIPDKKVLFEYTIISHSGAQGSYYSIPYVNTENIIEGCIIYPIDKCPSFDNGILGKPIQMNCKILNEDIPIVKQFFYSIPFIKWNKNGLRVTEALMTPAKLLSDKNLTITTNEPQTRIANDVWGDGIEINLELRYTDYGYISDNHGIPDYNIISINIGLLIRELELYLKDSYIFVDDVNIKSGLLNDQLIIDIKLNELFSEKKTKVFIEEAIIDYLEYGISRYARFSLECTYTYNLYITGRNPELYKAHAEELLGGGSYIGGSTRPSHSEPPSDGDDKKDTIPTQLPSVELMNFKNFVGYDKTKDCLKAAKLILTAYGLKDFGSSEHVYELMHEVNGKLERYGNDPEKNFQNAMDCIVRHIDAKRPIIVGVNHKMGTGRNNGTVDHFIVITGYSEDDKGEYFTYMETARYQRSASSACDLNKNRIYFSSPPPLLEAKNSYLSNPNYKYQITQVRPNDGDYEGTIQQIQKNK